MVSGGVTVSSLMHRLHYAIFRPVSAWSSLQLGAEADFFNVKRGRHFVSSALLRDFKLRSLGCKHCHLLQLQALWVGDWWKTPTQGLLGSGPMTGGRQRKNGQAQLRF